MSNDEVSEELKNKGEEGDWKYSFFGCRLPDKLFTFAFKFYSISS
jgi:hypothetical protein